MIKVWRKATQEKRDAAIQTQRDGRMPLVKTDSLNERARKLGIAVDMPAINRLHRRKDLKMAVVEESKKKPEVRSGT
jgi:hypothetical protein